MSIHKLDRSSASEPQRLDDWGPVGHPLSEPPCRLRGRKIDPPHPGAPETGLWECTPGRYRRQIRSAETMHILAGSATFTPDDGTPPVSLHAGDVMYFDADTLGVWDIHSTLRKVYVLINPARA
jgi:uncharacterized cupin superfamily protein